MGPRAAPETSRVGSGIRRRLPGRVRRSRRGFAAEEAVAVGYLIDVEIGKPAGQFVMSREPDIGMALEIFKDFGELRRNQRPPSELAVDRYVDQRARFLGIEVRSEEHTSELQSLMRISYAVLCLKKKKNLQHIQRHTVQ